MESGWRLALSQRRLIFLPSSSLLLAPQAMRSLSFSLLIVLGLVASTLAGDCSNLIFSSTGGKEHVYNLDALTNLCVFFCSLTLTFRSKVPLGII